MTDPASPIKDFYPVDFKLDLNGKRFLWQAVVLLPFIDERRLLDAIKPKQSSLTAEEHRRNRPAPHMLFVHQRHPAARQLIELEEDNTEVPVSSLVPSVPFKIKGGATDEAKLNELSAQKLRAELSGDEAAAKAYEAEIEAIKTGAGR